MSEVATNQSRRYDSRLKGLHALLNRRPEAVNFGCMQDRPVLFLLLFEKLTDFLGSFLLGHAFDSKHRESPIHSAKNNSTYTPSLDRKSTRLNSSHLGISYAVFCLKKK